MNFLQKAFRSPVLWLTLLSVCYFAIRLMNLTALPIFTDEAIYIRWSQIGASDASWRYISLTDGKQPLFTWFVMAAVRLFEDPLFAGRIVSVFSGFAGLIGMYLLGEEISARKRIGLLSCFFYLISPFALMYDRMAIYDSMVAAFSIWNLYLALLLVKKVRLDVALIFGMTLGLGMLNKTSAFFSLYLLPGTLLLFDWSKKRRLQRLGWWVFLAAIAAVLSQVIYSILRLSPYFYIISQKNTIFVYPFKEWITHPILFLQGNLHGEFDWLISYMTIPLFIAAITSVFLDRKTLREKAVLLGWWFLPFFALALFGKVLYPRFILFMTMPMYVLAAYALDNLMIRIKNPIFAVLLVLVISLPSMVISYSVISDIASAKLPRSEIGQYINDWPSGWGVSEIVSTLNAESEKSEIAVYTEGTFGLLPYALEIYLHKNPRIEIHGVWPPPKTIPADIQKTSQVKPTFYITNLSQVKPEWPMDLVSEYQKGNNQQSHIRLYKIRPSIIK